MHLRISLYLTLIACFGCAFSLFAQEETAQETVVEEEAPITGGLNYSPERDEENKLRDPFKSPFEIEKEKEAQREKEGAGAVRAKGSFLPYDVGELDLRGIYLDARTGYWAIFKIGDEYNWFQVDVKFRDGDLVNITDSAVIFKFYPPDDSAQVRDIVKELHRGEE